MLNRYPYAVGKSYKEAFKRIVDSLPAKANTELIGEITLISEVIEARERYEDEEFMKYDRAVEQYYDMCSYGGQR